MSNPIESTAPGYYRWYVVILLMCIYACNVLDRTVLNMLFEPIKHEFGLSDNQLGFLAGIAYAVPNAIASLPFGMLADRVNRKNLLAFVAAGWSALTAFSGLTVSYWNLLLTRAGLGAMEAGCPPNAISLVTDYFPPRRRSTATAVYMMGVTLGMLGGYAVIGVIAAAYGWRAAFFVAGIPGVLLAILLFFTVREPQRDIAKPSHSGAPALRTTLGFIRNQKALVHVIAALVLISASVTAAYVWTTSYLMRFHGISIREVGVILALSFGVFGSIGTTVGGIVADRMGHGNSRWRIRVPAITLLLSTILWIAILITTSKPVVVFLLCVWAIFSAAWVGPIYGLIVSLVVPRMRGTAMSLSTILANLIGAALGPQIIGFISDHISPIMGNESLRYALLVPLFFNLWAIWHCLSAMRTVESDLLKAN